MTKSINQILQEITPITSREGIELIQILCSNCNNPSTFKFYGISNSDDKRFWIVCQICNYGFKCKNFHLTTKPDFGIILNQMFSIQEKNKYE